MILRNLIGIFAIFFTAYTVYYTLNANLTLGLVMLYLIAAAVWGICLFYPVLAVWLQTPCGKVVGVVVFTGCLLYLGTALFLAGCLGMAAPIGVANPTGEEQAIIVLGCSLNGENVSRVLQNRLDAACALCSQYPEMPIVVSGGQGKGESIPEAVAMKRYLVQHGIAADRILEETASTSTMENFRFSKEVLRQHGWNKVERVVFVTNRFHCYRAAILARREGLTVSCVPCKTSPAALLPCYLREVLAVWYYQLRG